MSKLIIGSRGSRLAMVQTEMVADMLRAAAPGVEVEILKITTRGDTNWDVPLGNQAGIGIFVKELEEALLSGRIDLAVHSLKDMPSELPDSLTIAAVPERENPVDVLISRGEKLVELAPGSRIGTGSLRRAAQLRSYRPDLETVSIRGNVDTRIKKVTDGEVDAVILAAAALKRLGWEDRAVEYLPVEHFLPAVGQGALAIETRAEGEAMGLVSRLDHPASRQRVTAERAFLRTFGGGCQAPIAALALIDGEILRLDGMVMNPETGEVFRDIEEGTISSPEEPGIRLGEKFLAAGADKF